MLNPFAILAKYFVINSEKEKSSLIQLKSRLVQKFPNCVIQWGIKGIIKLV